MTRSQMIETVARKTGFTEAQVETTMDAMFDQIADCLRADEKVTIAGFGRFEMRPRKPKAYTNPKTKVSSRLESTSIPGFKASGSISVFFSAKDCFFTFIRMPSITTAKK